jgi:hypothetical protein
MEIILSVISGWKNRSEAIEHEAAVEPSAKTLHHETIFQFCYHLYFKLGAS